VGVDGDGDGAPLSNSSTPRRASTLSGIVIEAGLPNVALISGFLPVGVKYDIRGGVRLSHARTLSNE
jgi:hypothetical protein